MKQGANGRIFFVDHSKFIYFKPFKFVINIRVYSLFLFIATRSTQWEDPRLYSSPSCAGYWIITLDKNEWYCE